MYMQYIYIYKSDNFSFYTIVLNHFHIKLKSFIVLCEKFKIVSFTFSKRNVIYASPTGSRFAVILICYIAFGLESSIKYLLFT